MSAPESLFSLGTLPSPLGPLLIVTDVDDRLRALDFEDHAPRMHRLLWRQSRVTADRVRPGSVPGAVRDALAAFFRGELSAVARIAVATGGTAFQRRVWQALREIPAGETTTYSALARAIGARGACRAVGLANGANPVALIVPCHRVIGADGGLTGYAGGIERKRWLLDHERRWRIAA